MPGEVCYEPFSGSGPQIIAGERTGRRVYGLELSETFRDVIVNRWQAFTEKSARLDGANRSFDEVKTERLGARDSERDAA